MANKISVYSRWWIVLWWWGSTCRDPRRASNRKQTRKIGAGKRRSTNTDRRFQSRPGRPIKESRPPINSNRDCDEWRNGNHVAKSARRKGPKAPGSDKRSRHFVRRQWCTLRPRQTEIIDSFNELNSRCVGRLVGRWFVPDFGIGRWCPSGRRN